MLLRATVAPLLNRLWRACCGNFGSRPGKGLSLGGDLHADLRKSLSARETSFTQLAGRVIMDIVQLVNAIHYPAYTSVYSADVSHLSSREIERRKLAFGTNRGSVRVVCLAALWRAH